MLREEGVGRVLLFSCEVVSGSSETPWTVVCQAPLSVGFPRQEYCSALLLLFPGDLPDSGIELASPAWAGGFLTTEPPADAERQGGGPRQSSKSARDLHPEGEERELCRGRYFTGLSQRSDTIPGLRRSLSPLGPWCCCPHSLVSAEANSLPAPPGLLSFHTPVLSAVQC